MSDSLIADILLEVFSVSLAAGVAYRIARSTDNAKEKESTMAYLQNVLIELKYNNRILYKLKNVITEGPPIQSLWDPAVSEIRYFRLEAWDAVVRAGILLKLPFDLQTNLNFTDIHMRDVVRIVSTRAAGWPRIREWREHYVSREEPHQVLVEEYHTQSVKECREAINLALKDSEEAVLDIEEDHLILLEQELNRTLTKRVRRWWRRLRAMLPGTKKRIHANETSQID